MTFPETVLPITVELYLNGAWTDVTEYVYERDRIRITRGRADEASEFQSGRCLITFKNHDGRFSPRLPTGAYYGHIGRNTPIRVSVDIGDSYMLTGNSVASNHGWFAADEASLDITGDLEVQYDATLENWHTGTVELCGKGEFGTNQRSWMLLARDRYLDLEWSPTGGAPTEIVSSTAELPVPASRRLAVKATLDVDNGAGGHTVTFYTAPTISGPWRQLGEAVTVSGTTSIFSSTADLRVGNGWGGLGFPPPDGHTHAMKVLDGIGGTEVANPDFTIQTPGFAPFVDAAGLTWATTSGFSPISNRKVRFVGEVSEWPAEWTSGGGDVYVKAVAQGIKRRLTRGVAPIQSTLRRRVPTDPNLIAYWPMEDGVNTTHPASPLAGVSPMIVNRLAFQSDDTLAGSDSLPTFTGTSTDNTYIYGPVPSHTSDGWRVEFCYKIDEMPSIGPLSFIRVGMSGESTIADWRVQMNDAGGRVLGLDSDGNTIISDTWVWGADIPQGDWYRLVFTVEQVGGNFEWQVIWVEINEDSLALGGSMAGTNGRPSTVGGPLDGYHQDLTGMAVGHFAVFKDVSSTIFNFADHGFNGETARDRLERLAEEEGIEINVTGPAAEAMGAQRPEELTTLIQQCADADQGILGEERESVAFSYLDRVTLYDQEPTLTLNYTGSDGLVTPVSPTDDDRYTRNQVQVTIDGGTNQDAELATGGPLAIDQVGRYFDSWNLVLEEDIQGLQAANWKVHLGTWDESRYPVITVLLQSATHKIDDACAVDVGTVLRITDPPAWLPPDDIGLMVQGYEEVLHQARWELAFNCAPSGPWTTAHAAEEDSADDREAVRADTAGCVLLENLTTTEAGAAVHSSGAYRWADSATYPDDFPFDLNIGGERVTCTELTPYVQDTFTRNVANAWGAPTIAPLEWTTGGGVAANYNVNGSAGTHTMTTVSASRRCTHPQPHSDFDIQVDVASDNAPTGGGQFVGPMARAVDPSNLYFAQLEWTTGNECLINIRKRLGAVETTIGPTITTGHTFAINTFFRIRFRGDGDRLRVRVWLATEDEPTHWHIDITDSDLTEAGNYGVRSILASSNTDVNPVMSYDNWVTHSDQVMTLTRSVNGVVKTHVPDVDVRLWTPPVIAL